MKTFFYCVSLLIVIVMLTSVVYANDLIYFKKYYKDWNEKKNCGIQELTKLEAENYGNFFIAYFEKKNDNLRRTDCYIGNKLNTISYFSYSHEITRQDFYSLGKVSSSIFYDYDYDENNKLVKKTSTYLNKGNNVKFIKNDYYDNDFNKIKSEVYSSEPAKREEYIYNKNGKLIEQNLYHGKKLIKNHIFYYDQKDNLIKSKLLHGTKTKYYVYRTEYVYNKESVREVSCNEFNGIK